MAMNETFVKMVKEGKTVWRKADFDAIGISKEDKKSAGIVDCPRWDGWVQGTGDGVKLNVDGIAVTCYGTSNMTSDEKRYYYDHKGSVAGTPRSSKSVEQQTANRDMLLQYLGTKQTWSSEELKMLLTMTHCKDMLVQYIQTRPEWNLNELLLLVQM